MANDQPGDIAAAIREKVRAGEFEFSQHATGQTIVRGIRVQEVREAMAVCEIIEDYPDDKYGPSCLMLGFTTAKEAATRPLQLSIEADHQAHYPVRTRSVQMAGFQGKEAGRWLTPRDGMRLW